MTRISAGVDVSKNRSTVCIMDQDGKVIMRPFLVWHSTEELDFLADTLKRLNGEVRVIMESTSIYQYPIALHLKEKGISISIVNAYKVKKFANTDFRGGKRKRYFGLADRKRRHLGGLMGNGRGRKDRF